MCIFRPRLSVASADRQCVDCRLRHGIGLPHPHFRAAIPCFCDRLGSIWIWMRAVRQRAHHDRQPRGGHRQHVVPLCRVWGKLFHRLRFPRLPYLRRAPQIGAMGSPLLIGGFIDRGISWNVSSQSARCRIGLDSRRHFFLYTKYYYYVPLGLTLLLGVVSHLLFAECA